MILVWDAIRGFALAEAILAAIGIAAVLIRMRAIAKTSGYQRAPAAHIFSIALGTVLIVFSLVGQLMQNFGTSPHWWGLPFVALGLAFVLRGLWKMIVFQRHAVRGAPSPDPNLGKLDLATVAMYALVFAGMIAGFYASSGYQRDDCLRNNRQDALVFQLGSLALPGIPPTVRVRFKTALDSLRHPQRCPSRGF